MARHRQPRRPGVAPLQRATRAAANGNPHNRRLRCERLEDRRLLAVVTVDTALDVVDFNDGKTSLREAIFATNLIPGADEIHFDFGHDGPATILLTHGELKITDSLTITGPGAELLTIDASGNDPTPDENNGDGSRIFSIDIGDAATLGNATLSGLTLTGGDVQELQIAGGAIHSRENLTIVSCTVTDNAAFRGGGIYHESGALTVIESTVSANSSKAGGGIYTRSTTLIGQSTITNNFAAGSDSAAGGGGILHNSKGSLTIHASTISFNTIGVGSGAGVGSGHGALMISESEIRGNATTHPADRWFGGGIAAGGTSAHIAHTLIVANFASLGGGVWSVAPLTVIDSDIVDNAATSRGGGILAEQGLELIRSSVSGNSIRQTLRGYPGFGGGIYLTGARSSTIDSSTIASNSTWSLGGGIYSISLLTVTNSTISGNSAGHGGGVLGDRMSIRHSTVVNNSSLGGAGSANAAGIRGTFDTSLDHVIVAGNQGPDGADFDLIGVTSVRASLIGTNRNTALSEAPVGAPDANGNLIGGPVHGVIDPMLGPLADNGGPTLTHALLPGSPAIDAGNAALEPSVGGVPEFDQRGAPFTRLAGSRIDIGAYELQAAGGALNADFNFDGVVDGGDFLAWQRGLGRTSATIRHGDATADGDVDAHDLAVWKSRFDQTGNAASLSALSVAAPRALDLRADQLELARADAAFTRETASPRRGAAAAAAVVFTAPLPIRPWYSSASRHARWTELQAMLHAVDEAESKDHVDATAEFADDPIDKALALDWA